MREKKISQLQTGIQQRQLKFGFASHPDMAQPYNDQEECDEEYLAQATDEYDFALMSVVARTTLTEQAMRYSAPQLCPTVTISESPAPTRRAPPVKRQLTDSVADDTGTHVDSVSSSESYPGPKDMNTTFSEDLLESSRSA